MARINRIKKKAEIRNQLTNSQLTALKAQMNPHFMYNTLNSIQDLVLQNDIKNSNYYLSRYSSLMRKILDTSESNEIELAEEADTLKLYLELEQLRFGSDFTFDIEIDSTVDPHDTHMPSMIIQPFVENAIKHGLLHKKGRKTLSIRFNIEYNVLTCLITDNGIGRERSAEIKKRSPQHHRSFATRATEKRLSLINENREKKIILTITDLFENGIASGTEVLLQIPLT
jgi:sensor histidine kinase YesM